MVCQHICELHLQTECLYNICFLFEKTWLLILSQRSSLEAGEWPLLSCSCVCVCVFLCVFMCRRRLTEQQGLPGRANQSVGGPERSVLPAEHGAEGRRAAGAQSRPLLHLRPDILQTALHGGGRRGGEGGGRSTACPVYLQEGEARNNIDSQYQLI